jgi:hypothetical protein
MLCEMRNSFSVLLGEPEEIRLLGNSAYRWVNSIKKCLKKFGLKVRTG